MDPFFGRLVDPLTLHKYRYGQPNPLGGADPSGREWTLGSSMLTGAIAGSLIGMSAGAIYGARRSGQFFSRETLKWSLVGFFGGAAAGALVGGTIYLVGAGLSATGFRTLVQTGFNQLWTKLLNPAGHTKSAIAAGTGFVLGFAAGVLEPDHAVTLSSGITTILVVVDDVLVRGAIWERHPLAKVIGPLFLTHARTMLYPFVQSTTFIALTFCFGFTFGYLAGSSVRNFYDGLG